LVSVLACSLALTLTTTPAAHAAQARAESRVLAPGAGYDGRHQPAVRRLQGHLHTLGYAPGPRDGLYGPRTTAAVQRLQAVNQLHVDGITGPRTRRALRAQTRPTATQVKRVQRRLRQLGHRPGPVDGIFGPRTVHALLAATHSTDAPARLTPTTLAALDLTQTPEHPPTTPATTSPQTPNPTPPPTPTTQPAATPTPTPTGTPVAAATTLTSPQPTPTATANLQDTATSSSLTLQIALIVGVMLLIALWPFRRPPTDNHHRNDDHRDQGPSG
jgi:peptidoglycan hydrolase-like protein with peptidoglycan-binding domain